MSDLISRKAILKNIEKIRQGLQMMDDTHRASITMNGMYLCEKAVRNQPSVEKTGKWLVRTRHEHYPSGKEYQETVCSLCGRTDHNGDGNYCGYCGAKMKGEGNE